MGRLVKTAIVRHWPLFLILVAAFILRVWHLEQLFYFTYDESIPAFVGRRLILWQHIPLIGGVTPFNFHLGPYFYWLYALLLSLGKGNPIIWGFAGAVIASATTFLIYKLGEIIGSKKLGITAAIFWATSYLANVYDRHLWALYWGPLISLITLISLVKIITSFSSLRSQAKRERSNLNETSDKFTLLLGVTIALGIHADPSNLVFLLLAIIVWIIHKLPVKRSTFLALGLIIFSFLPLAVFDIRHNFANTKPVLEFIKAGRNNPGFEAQKLIDNTLIFPRTFSRLIYTFGDSEIAKQYSYCQTFVSQKYQALPWYFVLLAATVLVGSIVWSIKEKNNPWRLISLLLILYFLGIQLYGTIFRADIFEHYITGIFAVFLLIFAKVVSYLPKNLWIISLAIFVTLNLYRLSLAQNSQGLSAKRQAIEYSMQQVGDGDFSLDSLSTCWKYNGYRYLFAVFGREPVKSYVDPNFAYLYGTTPVAEKHPQTVVTFVVHDFAPETDEFYRRYALLKSYEVKSATFGAIEVIIMDNSSGWFEKS